MGDNAVLLHAIAQKYKFPKLKFGMLVQFGTRMMPKYMYFSADLDF